MSEIDADDENRHSLPIGDSVRRGAVTTAVAQAVTLFASTFVGAIVSHALGPAGKGAITAIRTLFQMLLQFGGFGVVRASHVVLSKEQCTLGTAILTFSGLFVGGMLLAVLVLLGFHLAGATWLERMLSVELVDDPVMAERLESYSGTTPFVLLAILTMIGGISHILRGVLQGLAKLSWMNIAGIAGSLLSLLSLFVLAMLGELTIVRGVLVLIAVNVLQVLLAGRWLLLLLKDRLRFDLGLVRSTLVLGMPLWIGEIGRFLFMRVDLLIVGASLGNAELGPYSVGYALMEMVWFFPRALGVASFRRIAGAEREEGLEMTREITQLSAVSACIGAIVIGIMAWPMTRVLYGVDFLAAVPIFFVLLPGALARSAVSWYEIYIQGTLRKPSWDTALQLCGGAMKIVFSLLVVYWLELGVYGVAIGSTLANISFSVLLVIFMAKITGRPMRWLCVPDREAWLLAFERLYQLWLKVAARLLRVRAHGDREAAPLHLVLGSMENPLAGAVGSSLEESGFSVQRLEVSGRGLRAARRLLAGAGSTRPGTVLLACGAEEARAALVAAQLLGGLRVLIVRADAGRAGATRLLGEARDALLQRGCSVFFCSDEGLAADLRERFGFADERILVKGEGQLASAPSEMLARERGSLDAANRAGEPSEDSDPGVGE
jgi:O-antigen/teichoic acid export membrane protein